MKNNIYLFIPWGLNNLFFVSILVDVEQKLGEGCSARFLEEEGIYVPTLPQARWKMRSKIEQRLVAIPTTTRYVKKKLKIELQLNCSIVGFKRMVSCGVARRKCWTRRCVQI